MASYFDPGGGMDRENAAIRRRNEARYQAAAQRQSFLQQAALTRQQATLTKQQTAPTKPAGLSPAARGAFGKAIEQYAPGGGFMKGIEAGLERGGTRAVASGMQGLVGAGLSNTTRAGGLGLKYEEETAAPIRAGAESQRVQGLAGLYAALGGAEQGAFEGSAGRGLGYAQLGASQSASAGQLGLGYAQLSASQRNQGGYYTGGGGGGNRVNVRNTAPNLF